MTTPRPAAEWRTTEWFNTPAPLSLADCRVALIVASVFNLLAVVSFRALPRDVGAAAAAGRKQA